MCLKVRCIVIIDLHCHILPRIDDGPENMKETIEMLVLAKEEGIRGIVATSHAEAELGPKQAEKYLEQYRNVYSYLKENEIPIELYYGNELYYSEGITSALQKGEAHTINGTHYILVEFPVYESYQYIERGLRNLLNIGCWPILAHVERYPSLASVEKIKQLVELGVCIQMNSASMMGKTGWKLKAFCNKLIKMGLVHVIATDAHGSRHRRPEIKECLKRIDKISSETYRRIISEENPEKILKGERICGEYNFK